MSELPLARTVTDELLVAIHDRLTELLDRLPHRQEEASTPDGAGPVEIREPASKTAKKAAARRRS